MFNRAALQILFLFVLAATVIRAQEEPKSFFTFQAEDGFGFSKDRVHLRANALKGKTVLLKDLEDKLKIPICLPERANAIITSVRFSTDGDKKRVTVFIDDDKVGHFLTTYNSNYGKNWNNFNTTTEPFRKLNLTKGRHIIVINLKTAKDVWGIEIDQVTVGFDKEFKEEKLTSC